ncbi:MAG: adenosylcobinamide-GDP ribazoletransferase [Myxococcales bacterium]|nr:adenosylcobinamide-GDP ribazoletransferase [Polyangiaceae bacterium]MDW8249412.1 adenosylcobinamide-GDP ribazoletransferase [Myxococcales bacterium]
MRTPPFLRGIRAALVFLTRIPVGGFPYSKDDWRWSSAHFPVAGFVVGLTMAAAWELTHRAGHLVASAIAIIVGMLVTGAFHEDGLADTADALGGAFDREKLFLILKDSRIGSFGGAALFSILLLRVVLLERLGDDAPWGLVLVQGLARTPPIWLMAILPYVTVDDASRSKLVTRARWPQVLVASVWAAVACALAWLFGGLRGLEPLWLLIAGAATAMVCGYRFQVRAGGLTGDFLGATEQLCEVTLMLALCLVRAPA